MIIFGWVFLFLTADDGDWKTGTAKTKIINKELDGDLNHFPNDFSAFV